MQLAGGGGILCRHAHSLLCFNVYSVKTELYTAFSKLIGLHVLLAFTLFSGALSLFFSGRTKPCAVRFIAYFAHLHLV